MSANSFYVTTSWDDGNPHDLRLAELLAKHGLPATFYVPISPREKVLSSAEIRQLSSSFEVGGHTVTHRDLRAIPYSASLGEIADCKDALEQITSQPCSSFCFPMGRFRRYHLTQLKAAGFTLARTVELMSFDLPRMHGGIALMPTTMQAAPDGASTYIKNAAKRLRPTNFMRWTRFREDSWVSTLEAVLASAADHGGVVHLWGHSLEIEQNADWDRLDRAFSLLAQYKTRGRFATNGDLWKLLSGSPLASGAEEITRAVSSPSIGSRDLTKTGRGNPLRP